MDPLSSTRLEIILIDEEAQQQRQKNDNDQNTKLLINCKEN